MKRYAPQILSSPYFFTVSLIFLHLLFFIWQYFQKNFYLSDSYEYLKAASNLKSNLVLYCGNLNEKLDYALYTKRPPVYPLFILACQLISKNLLFIVFVQNVLSIISLIIIRKILIKYGYSVRYDLLFILFLVFTPSQFIYSNFVMSETLLQFLIVMLVYFFSKYFETKRLAHALAYLFVLTLCAFTKPVFVYFIYVNIALFCFYSYKNGVSKFAIVSFIPLFFLFSYQYRNYSITKISQVSSIETINLLHYNVYHFLLNTKGADVAESTVNRIDSLSNLSGSYKESVMLKNQESKAIIYAQPFSYLIFHLKGVVGFFVDPGRFDFVNFFGIHSDIKNSLLYQLNTAGFKGAMKVLFQHSFYLLILMSLVLMSNIVKLILFVRFCSKNRNRLLYYVLILIFYVAILTGPLGASRFMMPLLPLYIGSCLIFLSTNNQISLLRKKK